MSGTKGLKASLWLYSLLMRLYPVPFRQEYGQEILLVFKLRLQEEQAQKGFRGTLQVWIWALSDLIWNVLAEQYSMQKGVGDMIKRSLDISFSILALVVGLPLLILLAALIKLDSPGPVLFVSQRRGENGRIFRMYKFRSMTHHSLDRHITRLGYVLRWTRMDEYPQFYNVFRGDMSLTGPRPLSLEHENGIQTTLKPGLVPWFNH
ncbi:MAG: sugar transferase [Chloroflexi bacterium]|nr:sugar transferase [Chloroflexota bacterium]MCC6892759.1 sugar transferase [Anaerolineae bacterium]